MEIQSLAHLISDLKKESMREEKNYVFCSLQQRRPGFFFNISSVHFAFSSNIRLLYILLQLSGKT